MRLRSKKAPVLAVVTAALVFAPVSRTGHDGTNVLHLGFTNVYNRGEVSISGAGLAALKGLNSHTSGYGVWGHSSAAACCGLGVYGSHAGAGIGVYGEAVNGFAVSGFSPNNWSGYFQGSVRVVGNLQKSSGSFTIDHPLDPANKYLSHSFVESPDMLNVYNGNVRTDRHGFATVRLPGYFQALNRTFRYQVTIISKRGWDGHAAVWEPIKGDRFVIRTTDPGVTVSWQVTGIREDPWANAHRIKVEEPKKPSERGKYLNPELYGQPATMAVVSLPGIAKISTRNADVGSSP